MCMYVCGVGEPGFKKCHNGETALIAGATYRKKHVPEILQRPFYKSIHHNEVQQTSQLFLLNTGFHHEEYFTIQLISPSVGSE